MPLVSNQAKPPKPTLLSRSQTTPDLLSHNDLLNRNSHSTQNDRTVQFVGDKEVSEDNDTPPSPSICRSPSWSNYGKERHRKEKEQKVADKSKTGATKAGKRLSKKPPAAMETQRMSAALRTSPGNSPVSPSTTQSHSRRSSSEDRRSSITSIGSSFMEYMRPSSRKCTQSRQPSPVENEKKLPDGSTPELAPKNNSSADITQNLPKPTNDSSIASLKRSQHLGTPTSKDSQSTSSIRSQQPATPPSSRSSQEPILLANNQTHFTSDDTRNRKQESLHNHDYQYPISIGKSSDETSKSKSGNIHSAPCPVSRTDNSVYNDRSYVQKQRMHQQQRSIAGYKDELAVGDFCAPLQWPPTPKDSTESIANSQKTVTVEKEGSTKEAIEEDDPLDDTFSWYNASLAEEARLVRKKGTNEHRPSKSDTRVTVLKDSELTEVLTPPSIERTNNVSSKSSPALVSSNTSGSLVLNESNNVKRKSTNASKPKYVIQPDRVASEAIIEGVQEDGLDRQKSLHRHHSDPELIVSADPPQLPSLDFLPELKHQPLVKPKRDSAGRDSVLRATTDTAVVPTTSQFPVPVSKLDFSPPSSVSTLQTMVKPTPIPPFPSKLPALEKERSSKRSSSAIPSPLRLSPSPSPSSGALSPKPLAKMFVICCRCKYWHDMPSRLYEAMAIPRNIVDGDKIAKSIGARRWSDSGREKEKGKGKEGCEGKVYTEVTCPWCAHGMSTACCAGWTAVVYLHERHH